MNESILTNHYKLSHECGELTRWLCLEHEAQPFELNLEAPNVGRMLSGFGYPVSPWPLLMSPDVRARFTRLVKEIPSLCRRAILRFFEDDPERFAERYGLSEGAYDTFASRADDAETMIARYDVVFVNDDLRLLEINVGTKLGGWEIGPLWRQAADMIGARSESQQWCLWHTDTLEAFFTFLQQQIRRQFDREATRTVVLLVHPSYIERGVSSQLTATYQRVAAAGGIPSRLLFCADPAAITVSAAGRLEYQGEVIHGLLVGSLEWPPAAWSDAHLRGAVFCPDSWPHKILADKTNFAILHVAAARGWLSDADARLVEEYIPWSARLTEEYVEWNGATGTVRDVALATKDRVVLKRGRSLQGRHVFVGKFMTDDEWRAALEDAGTGGEWLIQEYCAADLLYAPTPQGVAEHHSVWGVFGFGNEYGGVFGRVTESAISCGVVNSARGAKQSLVLDVDFSRARLCCLP